MHYGYEPSHYDRNIDFEYYINNASTMTSQSRVLGKCAKEALGSCNLTLKASSIAKSCDLGHYLKPQVSILSSLQWRKQCCKINERITSDV